ncbi:type II toxin-antitoxin system VapC family toxin [Candidatus Pacearchaeota archaeon]|nr:type II toxin-antitoxin system VapC family toxin [Candidatus Pacearchaeota archaeon]
MTETFLYDTYALIELLNKNPNYEKYSTKEIVINGFIFAEICYQLIKDNVKNLHEYLNEIEPAIINPSPKMIIEAMKFRYENKKKKMSTTDCISYIMAKELEIKFLTGDKEFEHLENVEFVKK